MEHGILISKSLYNRLSKREWKGRRVRSVMTLENQLGSIPAGTIFTITDKHGGFSLKSEPCSHCGAQFRVSKVHHHYVELLR